MGKTQTIPWDPAEYLETEKDMAAYLNVALEEGDLSHLMDRVSGCPVMWLDQFKNLKSR